MKKKMASVLATFSLLSGCVGMTPPLRQIAVDSNRLVAESADQQMLLNILRAKDRLPVHFSSMKYVRGNLSVSGTAELKAALPASTVLRNLDIGGNVTDGNRTTGAEDYSPSLSIALASNPNFETVIYDTKEFQSGILTPIRPSLIEYFLQQGWPEDFLSALFIARVDMRLKTESSGVNSRKNGQSKSYSLKNSPMVTEKSDFGKFIKNFEMTSSLNKGSTTKLLPISLFNGKLSLADIDKLDGKKFDLLTSKNAAGIDEISLIRKSAPSRGVSFKLRSGSKIEINEPGFIDFLDWSFQQKSKDSWKYNKDSLKYNIVCPDQNVVIAVDETEQTNECTISLGDDILGKIELDIIFRSPESAIYFLGSYARAKSEKKPVYSLTDESSVIIIKNRKSKNSLISAKHLGEYYSLERPIYNNGKPDHRGTQALVITQQLINLHKSADSLPTTQAIQVVP